MKEAFDVAIVGAGPAGLSAACLLADQGVKTIVVERGEYPGSKNISGGVLYGHDHRDPWRGHQGHEWDCRNLHQPKITLPLHREGSNLAMTSGRFAAEAMLEALEKGDFSRHGLQGYISRLQNSYIFKDLKKYKRFGQFLETHPELFTSLPEWASQAAREILTVNGVPKKEKQKVLWNQLRAKISPMRLLRIFWDGWRSVK